MTLDEIFKHGKESAEFLFKEQGAIHPMWICETEKGQVIPICIEMPDKGGRDVLAEALRQTFKFHKVARYVSILEAWVLVARTKNKSEVMKEVNSVDSLEHHPDRREAIVLMAEDIDGTVRGGQFFILRPEHGKATLAPFDEFSSSQPSEGRFAKLLNTEN